MAASRPKEVKGRFDLHEIKKLFDMVERSPIAEFEYADGDLRIRISKNGSTSHVAPSQIYATGQAPVPAGVAEAPLAPAAPAVRTQLYEVKSPMVGTFYRAPAPDADPYVRSGDLVEPGKALCIVEAMKLMNEIECEVRGRLVEILVENAQPVEYGQVLFRIDTTVA
jgi:acetyl-CoA carboxylase biotin carboxyl carrier protein